MHELALPIPVTPYGDESGYGYLLRASTANGVSISAIRRLLGIGANERIKRDHAGQLSQLFGCDLAWLSQALPHGGARRQLSRIEWYGHSFRAPTALRLKAGRICTGCLKERDYLRSVWDLSLYSACARHRRPMSEACIGCGRSLQWSRPAGTWCVCGRFLGYGNEQAPIERPQLVAGLLLETSFSRRDCDDLLAEFGLFHWLQLSPSGWHDLLMAFGLIERPFSQPPKRAHLAVPSTEEATRIAQTAMSRLLSWCNGGALCQDVAPLISQSYLHGLILNSPLERDRQVGLRCHEMIFGSSETDELRMAHPELRQLTLFGFEL